MRSWKLLVCMTSLSLLTPSEPALPRSRSGQTVSGGAPQATTLQTRERFGLEERFRLLEALAQAKPVPLPPYGVSRLAPPGSEPQRVVGFDPATGATTTMAPSARVEGSPMRLQSNPDISRPVLQNEEAVETGREGSPTISDTCTPPSLLLATHDFPWRTVWKLLVLFRVGATDYYYVCSAASVGPFHLITAGHCLYNWDPNGDGNIEDARFATAIWAWPAQTDLVDPVGQEDWPWGVARAVLIRTYVGWAEFADLDYDMGYITLDRRLGDRVGWMGAETELAATALHFDGYPTETPYVPAGSIGQYPGFGANNVRFYTPNRIGMCSYIYGGHSGGPNWRDDGTNFYIHGVNSTSDAGGNTEATRLTTERFNDLFNTFIPADEIDWSPVEHPDLIEYTLDLDAKDLMQNSVYRQQSFEIEYNVFNVGWTNSGSITVDFYLSADVIISSDTDYLIGSRTLSLGPNSLSNATATLMVPGTVPEGTYFAGWRFRCSEPEYDNGYDDNSAVITDETITVMPAVSDAEDTASRVTAFQLERNVPNPFNPTTKIRFAVLRDTQVELAIFDLQGKRVRTLSRGFRAGPNRYEEIWDGRDDRGHLVASGVYFYRMQTPEFTEKRSLVLIK